MKKQTMTTIMIISLLTLVGTAYAAITINQDNSVTFSYTVPMTTAINLGNASCHYYAKNYGYTEESCLTNYTQMIEVTDKTIAKFGMNLMKKYNKEQAMNAIVTNTPHIQ